MLFCICSDSGMTRADVRVGSCRYLLNQQTLTRNNAFSRGVQMNTPLNTPNGIIVKIVSFLLS